VANGEEENPMSLLSRWFEKPKLAEAPRETPMQTNMRLLEECESQIRTVRRELTEQGFAIAVYDRQKKDMRTSLLNHETYFRVGAMTSDLPRRKLQHEYDSTLRRLHELLAERADRMRILGMIH
jgi:hypothetical protein